MKPSLNSQTKQIKKLSFTVGIPTCYGDISILKTIRSIRKSRGVEQFKIILIADRTPISDKLKKELKRYKVTLIENKIAGSQIDKHRQILALTKTDILIFTQDDVLLDSNVIKKVLERFSENQETTMISIPYFPIKATSLFERVINVGTNVVNKSVKYWNNGDNYLSSVGRFLAFRTKTIKKFRMPSLAVTDNYYYFENKKFGGKFERVSGVKVYFKNPRVLKEHLRKSSRFQHAQKEMSHYFEDLSKEYNPPKTAMLKGLFEEFFENPFYTSLYLVIFAYSRFLKLKSDKVLNPIWEIDLSTKIVK